MKALAIILIFFISLLNPSKLQSKKEIIAAKNSYQQEQALLNESYLQYKSLSELLAQLSPEDPKYQSFKAAQTKAKKVLGPYKKQLTKGKTALETIIASFLGAQQEDIPKDRYRKLLTYFFKAASKVLKSRIGKSPKLKESMLLSIFQAQLAQFFKQIPGPLSKQLYKEVKAIPIDNNNVEDFLAAFLAILEKYSQEDQIKANWFNTFSIKEENLLKKISYQQLEPILDQALAKDDFLTEEELEERRKELKREKEMAIEKWTSKVENWRTQSIKTIYELMCLDTLEKYRDLNIDAVYVLEEIKEWDKVDDPKVVQLIFDYSRQCLPKRQLSNENLCYNMIKIIDKTAAFLIMHPEAWYENHNKVVLPNLYKKKLFLQE